MFSNERVLFFGGSDWWYHNPSSGIQLLREMVAQGNQALYVNSLPMRMPKPGKSGTWRRYLNKIRSYAKFLRRGAPGIWVLTPLTLPGFGGSAIQRFNKWLLSVQLRLAMRIIGWHGARPIVISATPTSALAVPLIRRKATVYYLCDKFDKFRDIAGSERISRLDREMVNNSDVLVCVSRAIEAAYKDLHPRCHYVPHGSNFELFNRAATEDLPCPEDIGDIKRPIIGYFGSVTESNDKDILEHIARSRPDWSIVLIGQVVSDYSRLQKYPNVHFLGKKALEEIPAYGRRFDVCIMNWVMNEWMHYCNPVKAKEYLAMGKPVVSVPIPEVVRELSDVVSIASTPAEFLAKIEDELAHDNEEKRRRRIERVRDDTWRARAEEIAGLIERVSG